MLSSGLLKKLLCYYFMFNCKLAHMVFLHFIVFLEAEFLCLSQKVPTSILKLNPIHLLAPAAQVFTLSKSNETFVQSQQNSSRTVEDCPTSDRIGYEFGSRGVFKLSY